MDERDKGNGKEGSLKKDKSEQVGGGMHAGPGGSRRQGSVVIYSNKSSLENGMIIKIVQWCALL